MTTVRRVQQKIHGFFVLDPPAGSKRFQWTPLDITLYENGDWTIASPQLGLISQGDPDSGGREVVRALLKAARFGSPVPVREIEEIVYQGEE